MDMCPIFLHPAKRNPCSCTLQSLALCRSSKINLHIKYITEKRLCTRRLAAANRSLVSIRVKKNFGHRRAPCGLRGCKNRPDPFPARVSYTRRLNQGLAVCHILACFLLCWCLLGPLFMYC